MQILIEIPNPPKKQEIVDIPIHFIDGDVCEAGGYGFKVLPPHGRLIDKDELLSHLSKDPLFDLVERYGVSGVIESRPTILEAEE